MVRDLIRLARPGHWIKNVLVLLPVVTASRVSDASAWGRAVLAGAAFCLAASAVYVLNDIKDCRQDRVHPRKKDRPIASGAIDARTASVEAAVFFVIALVVAMVVGPLVMMAIIAYLALQTLYTFFLSGKMLLDVICIALGFVLRAVAGAVAIEAWPSPWLFICTFTLCLFMGFCKRGNELATLGDAEEAGKHRPTLRGYTPELLTHLITLSAAIAVVAFLLYATSRSTVDGKTLYPLKAHYPYLIYTLPVVIYGVCRFAMLSMRGAYADPVELILRDRPFELTVGLWVGMAVAIVHAGQIEQFLQGLR